MKTILVTGGAGFIASNFIEFVFNLTSDYRIIVLDALTYAGNLDNFSDDIKGSDRFRFWYGNVTNAELVHELVSQSDIVIHFAAESHVARSIYDNKMFFVTDVIGTQTVANAVLKNQRTVDRFIHISTSEVYGTALSEPMNEDHPLNPCSPYASAKVGADRLVYSYWATYNIPAIIVRPFNQYGPRQHLEKVIPRFITCALKNEPLTVHGDGSAQRDWLYVIDTCDRIYRVMEAPLSAVKGHVFNLGSGCCLDILSIAKMILKMTQRSEDLITFTGERPGQVKKHISSTGKAEAVLGIRTGRPFEDGLATTIEWYRDNEEWWRKIEWMRNIEILTAT